MTTTDRATVIGVFASREQAEQAVEELHRQGFGHTDVGFIARDHEGVAGVEREEAEEDTTSRIAAGATGGGVIGGILGAAASLLIPGLGLVTAAGVMAATLTGLLAGSVTGGLIGAFTSMGLPEEEARYYESEVTAGRIVVTVNAPGRQREASAVLRSAGAIETQLRNPSDTNNPAMQSYDGETPVADYQNQQIHPHNAAPAYTQQAVNTPYEERVNEPVRTPGQQGYDPARSGVQHNRETMGSEVHTEMPRPPYDPANPNNPAYQRYQDNNDDYQQQRHDNR